jgi:hypothetical protein
MYPLRTEEHLKLSASAFMATGLADTRRIILSRGLELRNTAGLIELCGGPLSLQLPATTTTATAVQDASQLTGTVFLGVANSVGFLLSAPQNGVIVGHQVVEAIIHPADILQQRLRESAQPATGSYWSNEIYERVLYVLMTLVGEGHLGAAELEALLIAHNLRASAAHRYAFFVANVHVAIEDMRTVLLRALNRFSAALQLTGKINSQRPLWPSRLNPPREIKHSSETTQALYDAYVDSVLACSSTLDLLYKILIYVSHEPLGNPAQPNRLELPLPKPGRPPASLPKHIRSGRKDLGREEAPYALSNLGPGAFFGLRAWRNELTHNLSPSGFELAVYIGQGGTPVNGRDLQYVQFMSPDLDPSGDLAAHPWVPRLYKRRQDALEQLHGWLQETVLAIFDTLDWLVQRLDHRATSD